MARQGDRSHLLGLVATGGCIPYQSPESDSADLCKKEALDQVYIMLCQPMGGIRIPERNGLFRELRSIGRTSFGKIAPSAAILRH